MTVDDRERGVVKWFDQQKGYGFITRSGIGGDVFVHYRDIEGGGRRNLEEGWIVEFEVGPGKDGKKARAKEVTVVDGDGAAATPRAEAPTTWTADDRRRLARHLREALAIVEGKASGSP